MNDLSVKDLAVLQLSKWESLFNNQLRIYPDYYLEFRILIESSYWGSNLTDEIFHISDQYPKMHQILHNCWDNFESSFDRVFPQITQSKINEIRKLAIEVGYENSPVKKNFLLNRIHSFTAPKGVCSYYRAVERGFHICFMILNSRSFDSIESKKILKLLGEVTADANMSGVLALEKIILLESKLDISDSSLLKEFVLQLIKSGETESIEFKESLTLSRKGRSVQKDIEFSTLKAIAAFLNTDGGHLIIGVDDDGGIRGLEREVNENFKQNYDNFYRHIQTIIKDRLGPDASRLTNIEPISVDGRTIVLVEVQPVSHAIKLKNKFFIRKYAKCEELTGQALQDHLKIRFPL